MADSGNNSRGVAEVRREIETEREQLAGAAESLRESLSEATDVRAKLRANLPIAATGRLARSFARTSERKRTHRNWST